ncbi:hex-4 [Cordylochernes scorpioides]|uniref:beta-N-acetylhexosaminidase n=1 Tax=Cordylochernes scorpioides TaxID=51811 RepID=A0ABY6L4R7_9ARAC|nr:hex-4 [Cordylochernes scorpioides]
MPQQGSYLYSALQIIDQVVLHHPNISHIHIGCDEVEHIGVCEQCQDILNKNNWKPSDIFLNHVLKLAKYIKSKYKIQPIIWDDMLRNINEDVLQSYELGKYVWNYNPTFDFPNSLWQTYSKVFPKIWAASSFKGATGPSKFYTNITFHLENHKCWLDFLKENVKLFKYQGIVLTGWQRYDHFAVLCELFPASVPSLATNMYFLEKGKYPKIYSAKLWDALKNGPPHCLRLNPFYVIFLELRSTKGF